MKSQFLLSVKEFMFSRYYAKKTVEAYITWIKRFIIFHDMQHPSKLGSEEVVTFLTHLANEKQVAAKTQA